MTGHHHLTPEELELPVQAPEPVERTVWQYLWTGLSAGILALVVGLGVLVIGLPAAVGGMPLTVLSGSMEPAYSPGDLVVVKPTPADEIRVGEVMTYQLRSGDPTRVTHRVISRAVGTDGETMFVTKGDNNDAADETPVRAIQVVGTVWYTIPELGWVNHMITGPTRQWLVPTVAGALFAYAAWHLGTGLHHRARTRRQAHQPTTAPPSIDP